MTKNDDAINHVGWIDPDLLPQKIRVKPSAFAKCLFIFGTTDVQLGAGQCIGKIGPDRFIIPAWPTRLARLWSLNLLVHSARSLTHKPVPANISGTPVRAVTNAQSGNIGEQKFLFVREAAFVRVFDHG